MQIPLDTILFNARKSPVEKVGFSFSLPKDLKERFEFYCSSYNLTMSSVLVSFIEVFCDDCFESSGDGGLHV